MTENKKYYTEMDFNEFRNATKTDDHLILAVDGDGWEIWKDITMARYFYIDTQDNTSIDFHEVIVVANLKYDADINMECDIDTLVDMFDNFDYVGLVKTDEKVITYTWFRKIQ